MVRNHINKLICSCENLYAELENINTILLMTKTFCINKEFNGIYYSLDKESTLQLSEERNNYINMLTILSEKVNTAKNLNMQLEQEIRLHNDSDNRS